MYGCGTFCNVHFTHRGKRRLKRFIIILESYQNFQIGWKTWGEGEGRREGVCICPAAGGQGYSVQIFLLIKQPPTIIKWQEEAWYIIKVSPVILCILHLFIVHVYCVIYTYLQIIKGIPLQSLTPVFLDYWILTRICNYLYGSGSPSESGYGSVISGTDPRIRNTALHHI